MPRLNPLARAKLAQAQTQSSEVVYAYLEEEKTRNRYDFLLNPSSLSISVGSRYEENPTSGTNVPRLQFQYGEAQTLSLEGLLYVAPDKNTSLRPLLEAGIQLCRSQPEKQIYHSPIVSFVWGSRQFAPAIVQRFQFKETQWTLSGEPTLAEGSFTLVEVPPEPTPTEQRQARETQTTPEGDLELTLTPSLLQRGSREALSWVRSNVTRLDPALRERVRSSRFRLRTDPLSRLVYITDERGTDLRRIGRNRNGTFVYEAA